MTMATTTTATATMPPTMRKYHRRCRRIAVTYCVNGESGRRLRRPRGSAAAAGSDAPADCWSSTLTGPIVVYSAVSDVGRPSGWPFVGGDPAASACCGAGAAGSSRDISTG